MGFFGKITAGLKKTRESLAGAIDGMLSAFTKVDEELFEELGALQCATEEILGYVGTTERKLEAWCRKNYSRRSLKEMLSMIRQDGLIAIRRASFDQLKKSATIISQQYNRFLPDAGKDPGENAEAAIRAMSAAMAPTGRRYDYNVASLISVLNFLEALTSFPPLEIYF